MKAMPKWKPGKQKGKPVRVEYLMPINFKLDNLTKISSLVGTRWEGTGTGTKDGVTYTWHSKMTFTSDSEGYMIESLTSRKKNGKPGLEFENVEMKFSYIFDGRIGAITPLNDDGSIMVDEQNGNFTYPPEGFTMSEDGKTIVLNFYTATEDTGIQFVTYTKK